jgi:adenylate cyclase
MVAERLSTAFLRDESLAHVCQARQMAVMVTDVVGFTTHIQRLGDERAFQVFHHHDLVLRRSIHGHGGVCVNHTGDGFFSGFDSVRAATECALEIRRYVGEHDLLRFVQVRLRIALHVGKVLVAPERLFGLNAIVAFRLCARTPGGEIYASKAFSEHAEAVGYSFGQSKQLRLKGIATAEAASPLLGSQVARLPCTDAVAIAPAPPRPLRDASSHRIH